MACALSLSKGTCSSLLRLHELWCCSVPVCIQGRENPLRYVGNLAEAVHLDEQTAGAIELEQRLGLIGVDLQAHADGVLVVVDPTIGLGSLEQPGDHFVGVGHK